MTETTIRHYSDTDQAAVFEISADTAFFGEPVEAFLEDRKLYWDAFARYYTEYEASYTWVADSSGEVIGFLLGCADTAAQSKHWRSYIIHKVLMNALIGRYKLGPHTAGFAMGMLNSSLKGKELKVDLGHYPAHLQIGVRQDQRGKGIGKQLIGAFLDQSRQLGLEGVHLETTSHNIVACYIYETIGFQLIGSRVNRYWSQRFGYQIDDRVYGMMLR